LTDAVALALVVAAALYLMVLAVAVVLAPARATRFLSGFAGSARSHYLEMFMRLVAGGALLVYAPEMRFPRFFSLFGWALVITTAGLLAIPWQWHQRFAERVVPLATRHLWLVALGSLALGAFMFVAVLLGTA
jgi:hypothetical protein